VRLRDHILRDQLAGERVRLIRLFVPRRQLGDVAECLGDPRDFG